MLIIKMCEAIWPYKAGRTQQPFMVWNLPCRWHSAKTRTGCSWVPESTTVIQGEKTCDITDILEKAFLLQHKMLIIKMCEAIWPYKAGRTQQTFMVWNLPCRWHSAKNWTWSNSFKMLRQHCQCRKLNGFSVWMHENTLPYQTLPLNLMALKVFDFDIISIKTNYTPDCGHAECYTSWKIGNYLFLAANAIWQ